MKTVLERKQNRLVLPGIRTGKMAATILVLGAALGAPVIGQETRAGMTLEDYKMQGLKAAMQTKGALGAELMKSLQAGGPESAVLFCNTRALPLTKGISDTLGMDVSRVSDQPRNPANHANAEELAIIASYKDLLARGQQPVPDVREHDEAVIGYYPIVTNGMCLKCHGVEGLDISPATQAVIDARYPEDKATGYGENELRGLFVVKMNRVEHSAGADS